MTTMDLAQLAERLPYPLGLKLQSVRAEARTRAEGGLAPNLAFTIAAFNGLALRLAALVLVQAYVRGGASDAEINRLVVDKLRTPADGSWREVADRLRQKLAGDVHGSRVARWFNLSAAVPPGGMGWEMPHLARSERVSAYFDGAPRSRKGAPGAPAKASRGDSVFGALWDLVEFRNRLFHGGEAPSDEAVDIALLRVEAIARGAHAALEGVELFVRDAGCAFRVMGHVPQPVDAAPEGLEDGVPTLVFPDGTPPLPLAPLVRFRPGDASLAIDELFFVNAAALERLHYVGFRAGTQLDGKDLGTYEAFKAFWQKLPVTPSPKDPRLQFDELAAFHGQYFVGREEVLAEIASALAAAGDPGRYVELRALAGMGKTALLAKLYARQMAHSPGTEGSASMRSPAESPLSGAWAFHFCAQTEGRDYALVALRSVMAQLCDAGGIDRSKSKAWDSSDLKQLKDELLPGLLVEVARRAGRVVVALDALDESTGSDDEALAGCLPEHLPDGVTFLVSWRVDADGRASRVDRQLARIPKDKRTPLATANPLGGLARDHVVAFLEKVAGGVVSAPTVDAVWSAATTDSRAADPFFLRFVAEGARDGRIDFARAETVPASLEDAFEAQWLSLPTDDGFLAQRMLLLLGILREYGDDELIAELISRDPQHGRAVKPEDIALARQKLGKLLVYDGERYGLFHDRFRRFLVGEQKDPIAEALGEA